LQRRQHDGGIVTAPVEEVVLRQAAKLRGVIRSITVAIGNEACDRRIVGAIDGRRADR
jgi:hypothetical protein